MPDGATWRTAALVAGLALASCAARGPDQAASELTGRTWRLVGVERQPVLVPGRSTLQVAPDGRVSGQGGCNGYAGRAEIEDGRISFGPMLATKMACEPAVTRQEMRLFDGLSRAARWRVERGELTLYDAEGRELLRFVAPQR